MAWDPGFCDDVSRIKISGPLSVLRLCCIDVDGIGVNRGGGVGGCQCWKVVAILGKDGREGGDDVARDAVGRFEQVFGAGCRVTGIGNVVFALVG